MTSRYAIICRVAGTIVIDGEGVLFRDGVARREHSYGVEDGNIMSLCSSESVLCCATQCYILISSPPLTSRANIADYIPPERSACLSGKM
jgi:hypothetical protein